MAALTSFNAQPVSRRRLLTGGLVLGSLFVASCAQQAASSPTAASGTSAAPSSAPPTTSSAPAASTAAPPAATSAAPAAASQASPTAAPAAASAPQASNAAPVIPLWDSSTTSLPAQKTVLDNFQKQHPDIKVQPVYVPKDQYDQKADLMVAAGNGPSIFFPDASRCYRYYAAKGLILNLDPLIARDKYSLDDFVPNVVAGCKFKGSMMALPKSQSPWVLFYNKTAFDKAKVPYPPSNWSDPSWTWDKFVDIAKSLTITQNGRVTQFGTGSHFNSGWTAGWAFGGWWYNHDWLDTGWVTKYNAPDDPNVALGVQYWADMANKYHVAPTAAEAQSVQADVAEIFMTGRLATWFVQVGRFGQYAKIKDFEWGIAAWPHNPKDKMPLHHGDWRDQDAIFKNTPNPEGSWEFLKYVDGPEGQQILLVQQGDASNRKSLQQPWIDYWSKQIPSLADQLKVATDAMTFDYFTPDNWSVNHSPISDKVLKPALDKVSIGQQTAADTIKQIKPQVDAAIADTLKTMGYQS